MNSPERLMARSSAVGKSFTAKASSRNRGRPFSHADVLEDQRMRLAVFELHDRRRDVGPAVVVEVLNLDVRRLHRQRLEPGGCGHVLESGLPVLDAAIEVKAVGHGRMPRTFEVLAEHHVEQAVAVHVAEANAANHVVAAGVLPREHFARAGRLAKLPVPVVEEQHVAAAGRREEKVRPAVVVHVGRSDAEAGHRWQADRARYVLKLQAACVAKQPRAFRWRAVVAGQGIFADEQVEQGRRRRNPARSRCGRRTRADTRRCLSRCW